MKAIEILPLNILKNTPSEVDLMEGSKTEMLYAIRKLQLAIDLVGEIEVTQKNDHGQVFIAEYDIWINEDEYI